MSANLSCLNTRLLQALLRVFDNDVVAALGGSCLRLLEGVQRQQQEAATKAGGTAAAFSDTAILEWLLPLLVVLYLVRNCKLKSLS